MPELRVLVARGYENQLKPFFPEGTEIKAGDTKLIWNSANQDEVDAAKATFEKLTGKGYAAFRAEGKDGTKGSQIHRFDPDVERMILVPQLRGGR